MALIITGPDTYDYVDLPGVPIDAKLTEEQYEGFLSLQNGGITNTIPDPAPILGDAPVVTVDPVTGDVAPVYDPTIWTPSGVIMPGDTPQVILDVIGAAPPPADQVSSQQYGYGYGYGYGGQSYTYYQYGSGTSYYYGYGGYGSYGYNSSAYYPFGTSIGLPYPYGGGTSIGYGGYYSPPPGVYYGPSASYYSGAYGAFDYYPYPTNYYVGPYDPYGYSY